MGGSRWADAVDESAPAPATKPLSVSLSRDRPLGDRPVSFCRSCGCCFYSNKRGKPVFHCRPCYLSWSAKQGKASRRTTPSPASSSRDGSTVSGDEAPREKADVGADGLVLGLQRVLTRGVSFESSAEPPPAASVEKPPPPPPPPPPQSAVVPEPLNVTALLGALQSAPPPVPPAPPRPTTVDRGVQTGRTPPPCRSIAPVPRAF